VAKKVKHALNITQSQISLIKVRGIKHPVRVRAGTTDMWVVQEILLDEEYKCDLASEPKVIVDAGANIGCTSVYYANRYPDALIIAIEPEQSNYEMLLRNSAPYQNIKPVKAALWWYSGGRMGIKEDGCHAGFAFEPQKTGDTKTVSIGSLLKEYRLETIDILKMDIEGAERQVLENSHQWIDRIGLIAIGLHDYIHPKEPPHCLHALNNAIKGRAVRCLTKSDTTFVWLNLH
jgi:FkbM family methyltransferase